MIRVRFLRFISFVYLDQPLDTVWAKVNVEKTSDLSGESEITVLLSEGAYQAWGADGQDALNREQCCLYTRHNLPDGTSPYFVLAMKREKEATLTLARRVNYRFPPIDGHKGREPVHFPIWHD